MWAAAAESRAHSDRAAAAPADGRPVSRHRRRRRHHRAPARRSIRAADRSRPGAARRSLTSSPAAARGRGSSAAQLRDRKGRRAAVGLAGDARRRSGRDHRAAAHRRAHDRQRASQLPRRRRGCERCRASFGTRRLGCFGRPRLPTMMSCRRRRRRRRVRRPGPGSGCRELDQVKFPTR